MFWYYLQADRVISQVHERMKFPLLMYSMVYFKRTIFFLRNEMLRSLSFCIVPIAESKEVDSFPKSSPVETFLEVFESPTCPPLLAPCRVWLGTPPCHLAEAVRAAAGSVCPEIIRAVVMIRVNSSFGWEFRIKGFLVQSNLHINHHRLTLPVSLPSSHARRRHPWPRRRPAGSSRSRPSQRSSGSAALSQTEVKRVGNVTIHDKQNISMRKTTADLHQHFQRFKW